MFTVNFSTGEAREISRKSNAIKIAQRDNALEVVKTATGETVWASEEAPEVEDLIGDVEDLIGDVEAKPAKKAAKPSTTERRPYRLTGEVAAADRAQAEEIAASAATLEGFEMIPAAEVSEGDVILGRRKKNPAREVTEVTVGKKWVTLKDASGSVFAYAPVGTYVAREI